jgi:hypothetical protein
VKAALDSALCPLVILWGRAQLVRKCPAPRQGERPGPPRDRASAQSASAPARSRRRQRPATETLRAHPVRPSGPD